MQKHLWPEIIFAVRFSMVGILATAVHMLVVWILLISTNLPTVGANTFAFLTAFGISFAGNYIWTFGSPGNPTKALVRFLVISLTAFSVNTLLLALLVRGGWFSPVGSAIFSAAAVPPISFIGSRFWGFKIKRKTM